MSGTRLARCGAFCCAISRFETEQRFGHVLIKFTTASPGFGMVDSGHPIHAEWRQRKAMEPITATVVIIALVALAC